MDLLHTLRLTTVFFALISEDSLLVLSMEGTAVSLVRSDMVGG